MNPEFPRLRVRTARCIDPGELLRYADPIAPSAMLRRGDGIVGRGEVWRASFRGPQRISAAREAWSQLVAHASVSDDAQVPGSGLVAFAAFAFSAASEAPSVLSVPAQVIGRRDGVAFVTTIELDDGAEAEGADPDAAATPSLPTPTPRGSLTASPPAEGAMTHAAHAAAVRTAIAAIERGDYEKVVLARDLVARIRADDDRRVVLERLAAAYPDTWTYAVDGLVGASPEMLVRVLGREVAARVLAGTLARGTDPESDARARAELAASAKNRHEHRLAIDSALESLRGLDAHDDPQSGLTVSPEPFLLELPNVWHLASDIRGTLPTASSLLDLVEALHPTAAVGGTPRERALPAIDALEPFDRRRYAGPAGWLSSAGDGEFVIALRGAEVDADGTVTLFAGGGIVASSDPDEEFAETLPKFRPLLEALRG